MKESTIAAALGGVCLMFAPLSSAAAQSWVPGSEIAGHTAQVETAGVTNTVYFGPDGSARITTPSGQEVAARWLVENQNLCLETVAGVRECWAYNTPFQANQPITLTSNCQSVSRWTALSTTAPAPVMQQQPTAGERG